MNLFRERDRITQTTSASRPRILSPEEATTLVKMGGITKVTRIAARIRRVCVPLHGRLW